MIGQYYGGLRMKYLSAVCLMLAATPGSAATAQGHDGRPPKDADGPPPMVQPMPADGSLSLDEEAQKWGEAPIPIGTWPADKKEAKALRKLYDASSTTCRNGETHRPLTARRVLEACDFLLAQPRNPEYHPMIRAEYLQRRALALLAMGSTHLVLAALDESDALGDRSDDVLFDLSMGIGNDFLRAIALHRAGRDEEAKGLLAKIRVARPYSTSTVAKADLLEASFDPSVVTLRQMLEARIPLDPEVLRVLFLLDVLEGKVEAADALGDQLDFTEPKMRGRWRIEGDSRTAGPVETASFFNGMRAYVASAVGNPDKASAIFKGIELDLDDFVGEDPRIDWPGGRGPPKNRVKEYLQRVKEKDQILAKLEPYHLAIALRSDVQNLSSSEFRERAEPLLRNGLVLPLVVEQMRLINGYDAAEAKEAADQMTLMMMVTQLEVKREDIDSFVAPRETVDQYPKLASIGSKWLFSDGSGWSQAKEGDGEIRTVRYETMVGSRAMMEELLLLAIADLARREGRDAFVILSNRAFERVTQWTGYRSYTTKSGFEAQARVQLVDSANPPPEFAANPERILTVAQIERDLRPLYDEIMRVKEEQKAERR